MSSSFASPARVSSTELPSVEIPYPIVARHIGDFRRWKDHDAYQKSFARLLRDLKASDAKKA
jgi:hypothetical protein